MKEKFITFEGPEGSGKSTQVRMLARYLISMGYSVVSTREPGGTPVGELIRRVLLSERGVSPSALTEVFLFMAARAQIVKEIIEPALKRGKIVLCDRFLDATIAYQGCGDGVEINLIRRLGRIATAGIKPDLTILLDLPSRKGLKRVKGKKDRVEKRPFAYHERVRKGYLKLAAQHPRRIKVVRVRKLKGETQQRLREEVDRCLSNR